MNTQYSIGKAIMDIAFFHACLEIKKELGEKALEKCTAKEALDLLNEIMQEDKIKKISIEDAMSLTKPIEKKVANYPEYIEQPIIISEGDVKENEDPKPCPLCGSKPDICKVYAKTNHFPLFEEDMQAPIVFVGCPTCGIPVSHTVDFWNNRPTEAALKAKNEQLKDFLEKILDRVYSTSECSDVIDEIEELALQALKRN